MADGGTLARYLSREQILSVMDVVSPDQWESRPVGALVIHTEQFTNPKHPELPLYYVIRLQAGESLNTEYVQVLWCLRSAMFQELRVRLTY
jgi:hypothetical protein